MSATNKKFSIEISMDEIKLVVDEKCQFKVQQEAKLKAFSRIFRIIRILMQGQNPTVLHGIVLLPVKSFQMRTF